MREVKQAKMMEILVLVGLCGAAGCGEETEPIGPDPDGTTTSTGNSMGGAGEGGASTSGGSYVSGSRLKARTLVGTDGARSPAGWWDSQLEVECSFGRAADGSTRCLPPAGPPGEYFSDAGCKTPLASSLCGSQMAPYVAVPDGGQCIDGPRLYKVGAALNPASVFVAGIQPCTEVDPPAGVQFFSLASESPPNTFVGAEAEIEE